MTQVDQQTSLGPTAQELQEALEATLAWLKTEHGYQGLTLPKGRRNHALQHPIARALNSAVPDGGAYYVYPTTYNQRVGMSKLFPKLVARCAIWIDDGYYPELITKQPPLANLDEIHEAYPGGRPQAKATPPNLYEAYIEAYRRRTRAHEEVGNAAWSLAKAEALLFEAHPELRSLSGQVSQEKHLDYVLGWCWAQVGQQAATEESV